jgi:putative peptidoglycan lipid II flippase
MHRFTAILISGALASKLLGFAREILMAQLIGASLVADSFRSAITAIMLPLIFMHNESVPAILIPMDAPTIAKGGNRAAAVGRADDGVDRYRLSFDAVCASARGVLG